MRFIFGILITLLVFSCKKYPENNLWFKNPKKLSFVSGKITSYKVNGLDSLTYLDSYFKEPGIKFTNADIVSSGGGTGLYEYAFETNLSIGKKTLFKGSCEYRNNSKTVKIHFYKDTTYYKKNIFIESGLDWDIIYLSKKNSKRKMKTTLTNGNTYEIQFD